MIISVSVKPTRPNHYCISVESDGKLSELLIRKDAINFEEALEWMVGACVAHVVSNATLTKNNSAEK